jgi:APA family basic amino acid/polyamine antiporter
VLAVFTAFAYAELVSKYPRAAGAALYTQRAFRTPFFTFMVAFAGDVLRHRVGEHAGARVRGRLPVRVRRPALVLAAIAMIVVVAAINMRGIAESVQVNLVLTAIEVFGLLLIVVIGVAALGEGSGDFSRNFEFKEGEASSRRSWAAARSPSTR